MSYGCISIYTTFHVNKNNKLKDNQTLSPTGESWGEENKIKHLNSPHPSLLPLEKELETCVDTYAYGCWA
ncbi:hypothetical protein CRENPOLYSF2_2470004 [Crenothrix polyspora]|uniref:Uncharacterized protein n=1 Tax=Crenothrix polyspora TaxID=360316 RepID=A0A1R4H6U0_9GAMM|nr:hypothetical protein CRENPOLYSF2_2470004 [Crenothrix polyspora]